MREFNTTGPCDPDIHYTVMRENLISKGIEKVKKGRFFTIFAPRQSGKTTYFQLLIRKLRDNYTPIWVTFENLASVSREDFYLDFGEQIGEELSKEGAVYDYSIKDQRSLGKFFKTIRGQIKPIALFIDEFEGIPDCVINELMHTFRRMYHRKKDYNLHSLALVGVSTVAELVVSSASPFNIAEEFQIPYFSCEEVYSLISQYVFESGQSFEENAIKAIYENTGGQPGLVCAVSKYIIETLVPDRKLPVTINHYYKAQNHFLTERFDKNIINIVQKAREKKDFILKLLFSEKNILFSVHDPDIAWLYANGVIDKDNGNTDMLVPLYKKVMITAFRPLINGESDYYIPSLHETMHSYLTPDHGLNVNALLKEYSAYVRRRGFRAFDNEKLKEAACHYSLDGFINFFIVRLGGQTFIEVPSGRGRTDILIRYKDKTYIIEIKIYSDNTYFQKGKIQLAQYLKSEGLSQGYYAVFSSIHTEKDILYSDEIIDGRKIYTHIILTNFEQPSRLPLPEELKITEPEIIACNMLKMGTFSKEQIAQATGVNIKRIESLSGLCRADKEK
ncbi:NTP hydrolase p-loop-containing [Desulfonema limicola]|uniref:NTP hydrolase p-loop-containing n=1 Tax=Desulfonema limicola TaxID=45656 RepID=A0A975GE72_9BACT|nr:ATP-binding protein [Desulfonema limicola]QTA77922.1 NTP hydrolase p-loop-containing [Desulfonema limicola]